MAEIKKYLYNDLTFKIATGIVPVIVNNELVKTKQSIPQLTWNIDFGEPNSIARINPRIFTPGLRCDYCGRRYEEMDYECSGCGAPT